MRNFKDIIIEKLKVSTNTNELPDFEDFKTAIYNLNTGHEIIFEEIDPKYKDLENCPNYKYPGNIVLYIASLCIDTLMNNDKILFAICYENASPTERSYVMINKLDDLINKIGEELVLQILDYIK